MNLTRKILALLLALTMVAALAAGCEKAPVDNPDPTQAPTPTEAQGEPTEPTTPTDATYTYQLAQTVFPTNWNPCQMQTATDGDAMDYIVSYLYGFDYNDDYTAYELEPIMAAADPVDVTAEYVGEEWGIAEGETGKAFRIALNPDACWENGEPITADTYVYSMQQMLDPAFANYRASGYYEGSFQIHNAKNYVYSGQTTYVMNAAGGGTFNYDYATWLVGEDGQYTTPDGVKLFFSLNDTIPDESYGMSITGLLDAGYWDPDNYAALTELADENGYIPVTADTIAKMMEFTASDAWGNEPEEAMAYYVAYEQSFDTYTFDQVGIKAIDDYTLDLILDKELIGFYIKYNFNTTWLVYEDLYEQCKTQDPTTGAWSSTYGTSAETTMSFGPYRLASFVLDQQITWERNENWFGYKPEYADRYGTFIRGIDGVECPQFMTDKVVWTLAADISTREEMFLKGQLDQLGLNRDMLAVYGSSDALYFTEGESTFYGIINSDYDMLLAEENILNGSDASADPANTATPYKYNKTILAVDEFRKALCYALDRTSLCAALYPAGTAAFSLYSNNIIADPLNSVPLNDFESIRAGVCEFWGVTYGEGGEFATLDEAYDAITGFDIDQARVLIDEAVDIAIANGWMTADSIVSLVYCAATASDTETKWFNFFKGCFDDLMKGTKLEGKFEYTSDFTLGNEFGTKIQNGECDTAWGFGWSGSALDPYSLFEVYVDGAVKVDSEPYQYDKWIDRSAIDLTLNYDIGDGAQDYTYSIYEWWAIINGTSAELPNWSFGKVDDQIRADVLAKLQTAVLLSYTTIPLMNEGAVQLKSYKVNWGQEEYIYGVGRGGYQYLTYNYSDAEWADYCASQDGGILKY